jgi:hypothetical protein
MNNRRITRIAPVAHTRPAVFPVLCAASNATLEDAAYEKKKHVFAGTDSSNGVAPAWDRLPPKAASLSNHPTHRRQKLQNQKWQNQLHGSMPKIR